MAEAASNKPLPPGKMGLPLLGETVDIAGNNHGFYIDRFRKYGPIFKTRLFGINFVVLSGPEAFEKFSTDPAFVRGEADPISVKGIFQRSLALTDGVVHRTRKRVMRSAFDRASLEAYLPRIEKVIQEYVARWEKMGTFAWQPELRRMSASLTSALYNTGDSSDAHIDELNEILGWMRQAFGTLMVLPIPGTVYGKAMKGRKRIQEILKETLERHQKGGYDDVVSRMLVTAAKEGVKVEDLRDDLLHLVFAGQGGFFVPNTLTAMTLGQNKHMMERARAEVMAQIPDGPLTLEGLDRCEYLERLTKETRRFFAMNSATFFARVKKPVEVGGYTIPAGWGAIAAIHITMRSESVWDDPNTFDPDRFLPERIARMHAHAYVPHGGGSREGHKCPGEDIVSMVVRMFLALSLRRFTWELPRQDLTLQNELFPLPASGLQVRLVPVGSRTQEVAARR